MGVELSKMMGCEGSVEGIKVDIYSSGANVIRLEGDKMVSFARVRGHLGLLGCRGGVKFGTRANNRNFDGFRVGMKLFRIVNVSLFVLGRGRESKVADSAEVTKGSVEVNRRGFFKSNEMFKVMRDGFKVIMKDRKMGEVWLS